MNLIDGFRLMEAALQLRESLAEQGGILAGRHEQARFMEVCGSHTMAIARHGIRSFLPENITLLSGPGCPVCVTDPGIIDAAIDLTGQGHRVVTFGDMLRVPGSRSSLEAARAYGGSVEVCYSPMTALELARQEPRREVVFLAIGFETTIAPVMAMLRRVIDESIANLTLLTAFKRIPPALSALIDDPEVRIDGLLCPPHVSAIIGADAYHPYAEIKGIACVVAGFEPLDILYGLLGLTRQRVQGVSQVDNQYNRVVKAEGNLLAQRMIDHFLVACSASWRGLGAIPESGLELRDAFKHFDACHRFGIDPKPGRVNPQCRCGSVLKGMIVPAQCPLFGDPCHPGRPLGPCMVSSEGSCAAEFKYASRSGTKHNLGARS
ncbi:MAG: hydrogenase formation protein HypD [Magnetococcus sp. THC-1_WYH]